MFDDYARRLAEHLHTFQCCISVRHVVIRKALALKLLKCAERLSESEVAAFWAEVTATQQASVHENVVRMYGACVDSELRWVGIVMEVMIASLYYVLHEAEVSPRLERRFPWLPQVGERVGISAPA